MSKLDLTNNPGFLFRRLQQISVSLFLERLRQFGFQPVKILDTLQAAYQGLEEEHLFDMEYRTLQHAKLQRGAEPLGRPTGKYCARTARWKQTDVYSFTTGRPKGNTGEEGGICKDID